MCLTGYETVHFADLTASQLKAWLESHGWGANYKHLALYTMRAYLKWKYRDHQALTLRYRREETPPQRVMTAEQVVKLLASFDGYSSKGCRDLAMCGVFLDCGLRSSEICRLQMKYLDMETLSLRVIVKGGRWSRRTFSIYTSAWLTDWFTFREKLTKCDRVFVGVGGIKPGTQMTSHGLRVVARRWGENIGIKLSPHDFRRTMASLSTAAGAPDDVTMKGGGWKSPDVFRRYTVGITADHMAKYHPTKTVMENPTIN
ncbi:tyrosine-type recombinase/integrase [Chloroflexota bacterium]